MQHCKPGREPTTSRGPPRGLGCFGGVCTCLMCLLGYTDSSMLHWRTDVLWSVIYHSQWSTGAQRVFPPVLHWRKMTENVGSGARESSSCCSLNGVWDCHLLVPGPGQRSTRRQISTLAAGPVFRKLLASLWCQQRVPPPETMSTPRHVVSATQAARQLSGVRRLNWATPPRAWVPGVVSHTGWPQAGGIALLCNNRLCLQILPYSL